MAAERAINPIFEVFSLRCGVSEIMDAGIAIESFFFVILIVPYRCVVYVVLKRRD
jgi:hypothetical protein